MIHSDAYLTELTWHCLRFGALTKVKLNIPQLRLAKLAQLDGYLHEQDVPGLIPTGGNNFC